MKQKFSISKTWIAILASLGVSLITIATAMTICVWKYGGKKGILFYFIYLFFFVLSVFVFYIKHLHGNIESTAAIENMNTNSPT